MKKLSKVIACGIVAVGIAQVASNLSLILTTIGFYNSWEILETGGFHEAANYLNSRVQNEAARVWMDKSIEAYKTLEKPFRKEN